MFLLSCKYNVCFSLQFSAATSLPELPTRSLLSPEWVQTTLLLHRAAVPCGTYSSRTSIHAGWWRRLSRDLTVSASSFFSSGRTGGNRGDCCPWPPLGLLTSRPRHKQVVVEPSSDRFFVQLTHRCISRWHMKDQLGFYSTQSAF